MTRYLRIASILFLVLVLNYPVDAQVNPIIDQVSIEGNEKISTKRLLDLILTKPGGLIRKRRYRAATFRADRDAIETFYHNSGFLDARERSFLEYSDDGKRLNIRIVIDEGPRYTVDKINILGNQYLTDALIQSRLLTREGQPFFRLFMAADERSIQIIADQQALLDAIVDAKAIRDDINFTITVNFFITEGAPIRVGDILIRGHKKTRRSIILREIALKQGDLYDNAQLIKSQTQLFQTGLFRSVRLEPLSPDTTSIARDLLVSVIELPGGEISFGGGFASVERFRGSVEVAQRNWLGRAITIGANTQFSELKQRVDGGITHPWLFRTRTSGTLRGFFDRLVRPESHTRVETGSSISAGRTLSRTFRSQTAYTIKNIWITDPSDSLRQIIQSGTAVDSLRTRREGSLSQIVIYDTRNDILDPRRGFYGQIQGELASPLLGSSSENQNSLLALNSTVRKYVPIRKLPDLAVSLSFGYVRALNNGKVPLDRKLFLGGDRSVRGFGIDQLGPLEGGVFSISSQNEVRLPLPYVSLAGFIDWGGVSSSVDAFSLSDIRVGYGGGIRVVSPIGLIRTDVGFHRLGPDEENTKLIDRTFFYFGLGQAF